MTEQNDQALQEKIARSATEQPPPGSYPDLDESDPNAQADAPQPEPGEKGPQRALTAFVIVIDEEGNAVAHMNPGILEQVVMRRLPTFEEMRRACNQVVADIDVQRIAMQVLGALGQQAQMAMRVQQDQRLAAKLAERGIRPDVPPPGLLRGGVPLG